MKKIIISFLVIVVLVAIYSTTRGITSEKAVALVQKDNPELQDYPSDNLPPKRIETQKTENGWFIGFYSLGSGLPGILQAQCYMVSNDGAVSKTGEFSAGGRGGPDSLDLGTCSRVSAVSSTALTYFTNAVTAQAKTSNKEYEKLGLGGGVDGFILVKTYPKLLPSDFTGVAALGGSYSVNTKGELLYTGNAASNSGVLTEEGMRTLLENVAQRLSLPAQTDADVNEILRKISADFEGEADPSRMNLNMKKWVWQESKAFAIEFGTDGNFSATTDCNQMEGSYAANKTAGTLSFSNVFMTKMYCEGSREQEFATILGNTSGFQFTGKGELILKLKTGGTAVFR